MDKKKEKSIIQKPVSMVIDETREKFVKAINESNLHMTILEMIVKELYLEIRTQAELVSANEKAEYESLCNEENKKTEQSN